jgi:hypothetical protein
MKVKAVAGYWKGHEWDACTVGELIAKLQEYPPDMAVILSNGHAMFSPLDPAGWQVDDGSETDRPYILINAE